MAPEVISHKPYGREVDIWGFGSTVFELIDGQPPYYAFPTDKARELISTVGAPPLPSSLSAEFRDFLSQCNHTPYHVCINNFC